MGAAKPKRDNAAEASVPSHPLEERRGFRAVGAAVSKLSAPILAKRGGGILVRLKAEWSAILGPHWADMTWPRTLSRDGVLKLNTASCAALEVQHSAPLLIERINLFFGRPVVARLAFVQGGPVPLVLDWPPGGPIRRPLGAAEADALDQRLSGIADPELRAALAKLGRAVIGNQP